MAFIYAQMYKQPEICLLKLSSGEVLYCEWTTAEAGILMHMLSSYI